MTYDVAGPIVIGRFGKSFGISGWIKIISFTTPKENILAFKPWLIQKNNTNFPAVRREVKLRSLGRTGVHTSDEVNKSTIWEEFCFENCRKHSDRIVVKIPGCNSPEEASRFTNIDIGVWRKQLPKLKGNEYYWSDLVGLEVINKDGVNLGIIQDLMATGSNDVLVVVGKSKRLIPYISNVVIDINLTNKIIQVDWPEDY